MAEKQVLGRKLYFEIFLYSNIFTLYFQSEGLVTDLREEVLMKDKANDVINFV